MEQTFVGPISFVQLGLLIVFVGCIVWLVRRWAHNADLRHEAARQNLYKSEAAVEPDLVSTAGPLGAVAVSGILFVVSLFLVTIPAGYVGIVTNFGKVQNETITPGLHFLPPVVTSVIQVDTRVRGIHFENLAAASKEYQDVIMTGTLNVHVDGPVAAALFQNVGLDFDQKIVIPFYTNLVKEVVPTYGIAEILPKREEIRKHTVEKLTAKLAPYGVIVDDVAISNIAFSEAYTHAIEDKQVQEQKVQTERQILEQRRIQADQAVASAKGEAESTIERARGQAEANRLISNSLTDEIIQYQAIQKLSDKITVALLPSDNGFILDLKSLKDAEPK